MSEESEFGKGLVICLVKFVEHAMQLGRDIETYRSVGIPEADAISTHFNGASDHLYEIEVPEKWKGTEINDKVNQLRDKGLEIGHGFTGKKYTIEDAHELYDLCRDIALLIDSEIGLNPEKGTW